jgi:hypothetical protein
MFQSLAQELLLRLVPAFPSGSGQWGRVR